MHDLDRMLGAFDEFKKWEEREHKEIKEELKLLREAVQDLKISRGMLYGFAVACSAIGGFIGKFL